MNILRFYNSYLVTIPDFCTHMKNSLNSIISSVHPDFWTKNFVRRFTNNLKEKKTVTILGGIEVLSKNQKSPIAARVFQNQNFG